MDKLLGIGLGLVVLLVMIEPVGAQFDYQAQSCSQAHVEAAIGLASNGDTVTVPPGQCTWVGQTTIDKAITLRGSGTLQTIIIDSRPAVSFDRHIMTVNLVRGRLFRITNMQFWGDGVQVTGSDGMIRIFGCSLSPEFRIDNSRFDQVANFAISTFGAFGLFDHNVSIAFPYISGSVGSINYLGWPRDGVNCTGQWGDGSWAFPLTPGGVNAVYFEDNTIQATEVTTSYPLVGPPVILDSNNGARTVFRRNTLVNVVVGSHGTDGSKRLRGNRWLEIYDNFFTFENNLPGLEFPVDAPAWIRGGSGVYFNNRVSISNRSIGFNWNPKRSNRRDVFDEGGGDPNRTWRKCDGTHGPTNTGGGVWDGGTGTGESDNATGYRCLDQPGSGTSVDWGDQGIVYADVILLPPANNTLEPIYSWGNTVNLVEDNMGTLGLHDGHVIGGRDFKPNEARPAYTPLPYPHPLAAGTLTPPGTPSGLTVTELVSGGIKWTSY